MIRSVAILAALVLALAACGGDRHASGYGITVTAPPGWHVRVLSGALEAATLPLPARV